MAQHQQDTLGGPTGRAELPPSLLKTPRPDHLEQGVPRSPCSRSFTLASRVRRASPGTRPPIGLIGRNILARLRAEIGVDEAQGVAKDPQGAVTSGTCM